MVGFTFFCLIAALMSGCGSDDRASRGAPAGILPPQPGNGMRRAPERSRDARGLREGMICLIMALGLMLKNNMKLVGVVVAVVISSCSLEVTQTTFFREIAFQLSIVVVVSMAVHVISQEGGGGSAPETIC